MPSKTIKKFTDNLIIGLKPEKSRYDVSCNGLVLRVSPNGKKFWIHNYRFNGKTGNRITIGQYPYVTLAEANEKLFNIRKLLGNGIDPKEHAKQATEAIKKAAASEISVQQLYNLYMNEKVRPNLAVRTINDYEKEITKHILKPWASLSASSMERTEGIQLLKDMVNRGQNEEARRMKSALSAMWQFALDHGIIKSNPFAKLPKIYAAVTEKRPIAKAVGKKRFLTDAEIYFFWHEVEKNCTSITATILKLMLLLGRRGEDVRPMKKDEIDLNARIWHMTPAKIREEKKADFIPILMPLPQISFDIIQEQIQKNTASNLMFQSTRIKRFEKEVTQSSLSQPIQDRNYFGLEPFTPKDLRRTTSTGLGRIGVSLEAIDQVLAHSMSGLAKVYNRHDYLETRLEALTKWNDHVYKIVNGPAPSQLT